MKIDNIAERTQLDYLDFLKAVVSNLFVKIEVLKTIVLRRIKTLSKGRPFQLDCTIAEVNTK